MFNASREKPFRVELVFVSVIFILVNLQGWLCQDLTQVYNGRGWDGVNYYDLACRFVRHLQLVGDAPCVFRVGTPWLVSLASPKYLLLGFLAVNMVANYLAVLLLTFWFKIWIRDWQLRTFLSLLFQSNWVGQERSVWIFPVMVDSWAIVFLLLGLLLLASKGNLVRISAGLCVLSFFGMFFREIIFAVPFAFWFVETGEVNRVKGFVLKALPTFAALAAWFLVHQWVDFYRTLMSDGTLKEYSFIHSAWNYFLTTPLEIWILSWFVTFGPVLFVLFVDFKNSFRFWEGKRGVLAFFLAILALSWIGGRDFERFFFWVAPVVYAWIGTILENEAGLLTNRWITAIFFIFQSISQRAFWTIPDQREAFESHSGLDFFTFLTSFGKNVNYLDLCSWNSPAAVARLRFIQYFLVCVLLVAAHWVFERKRGGPPRRWS